MHTKSQMVKPGKVIIGLFVLFVLMSSNFNTGEIPIAHAQNVYDPTVQSPTLLYDEARTVYLGNLARRDNGVPPLRWNLQLTHAGRWFSWDSVENRPGGYCGHQDTQGQWPDYRARAFGYLGSAGAENAFCGYDLTPEGAINGWMNSPGHRANLLDPNSREIGLGYYHRASDGRGYVTQGFGNDAVYAPVIIEHEAISTTSSSVNLYIYDRLAGGGFAGLSPATQMMVSNNAQFSGAAWEAYNLNKPWTLANGNGWRDVYVKTRDSFNRNLTVSDTIYLGANVPLNELGAAQMSTRQSQVTIYGLNGGALPQVQFSLGWLADDTFATFGKLWGNGERVNDAAAWGGTAFRLYPASGESSAWVWDTAFIKDTPLVAYFRLKVNNNTSSSEVARISVEGGDTVYGPLSLLGTDFAAPNQYQEFAINFTHNSNTNNEFLTFQFWQSGTAEVYVDAVSIFSAPQAITSPLTWSVPGNNYRGQGVWVRYTNGSQFSTISEGITTPYAISGNTGVGGVTLSYNDGTPKTVIADGSGNYSISVPPGWSGTITPSHACFTFNPSNRSYSNLSNNQAAQNYTATFNSSSGCADIDVLIAGNNMGSYALPVGNSLREGYAGVDNGPAKIVSANSVDILSALRVIWKEPGTRYSYSEMMGLPKEQLSTEYWFPWYNNTDTASMDQGFRIANVDTSTHTIRVFVGTTQLGSDINLAGGASTRVTYDVNNGPIRIACVDCTNPDDKIIAALRVIWKEPGFRASYSEMMGLPKEQLSNEYWFPWYNNAVPSSMDQGFRIANVSTNEENTVDVRLGDTLLDTITLGMGASVRVAYNVDNGPIKIVCTTCTNTGTDKIIAALRVIWKEPGFRASYSEMMGLPTEQLSNQYWFPWYNNAVPASMDQGFRIANVSTTEPNTVEVWVGSTKLATIPLGEGGSTRVGYNVDNGPIKIICTTCTNTGSDKILAALRVIWKEPGFRSSYSEMMGLPHEALSTEYWFPWYNFASPTSMDQGFRIAVP